MILPTYLPSPPRGVWDVGPIPVRAYALCIIVGIIVAGVIGSKRFVRRGGRPGRITDLAIWMVPFGLVGGRLYHLITDPELYFEGKPGTSPWRAFAIWDGGLGIWGAIALGALGAYLGCRHYKIPFAAVADALAPGIVLAQGIGRLGNYFNQELFGDPTTMPWGLEVFLRTPGGASGTLAACQAAGAYPEFPTTYLQAQPQVLCGVFQPTFLYELIWDVLICLFVIWADHRFRLGHGRAFALYVAGYCMGRGYIETLRSDHANHILGIRINVFVAIAVGLLAVIYLIVTRRLGREDPDAVWGQGRPRPAAAAGSQAVPGRVATRDDGSAEGSDDAGVGAATHSGSEPDSQSPSDSDSGATAAVRSGNSPPQTDTADDEGSAPPGASD